MSQIKKSDENKLVAELEKGYKEMADINLELAQMCLEADNESLSLCEEKLSVSKLIVKRGDIYYADLSPVVGSEQGGIRPVLVIQNDIGNKYSPTVIAAAITSQINKAKMPTHIELAAKDYGLNKDSVIFRTIDKRRLREKIGRIDDGLMASVNNALSISFGLGGF